MKLNDVVLYYLQRRHARYLEHHRSLPRKSLIATIPVSLRAAGGSTTTQATLTLVNLATHIADPLKRGCTRSAVPLPQPRTLTNQAKSVMPTDFPSLACRGCSAGWRRCHSLSRISSVVPPIANLLISNVPRPAPAAVCCRRTNPRLLAAEHRRARAGAERDE